MAICYSLCLMRCARCSLFTPTESGEASFWREPIWLRRPQFASVPAEQRFFRLAAQSERGSLKRRHSDRTQKGRLGAQLNANVVAFDRADEDFSHSVALRIQLTGIVRLDVESWLKKRI